MSFHFQWRTASVLWLLTSWYCISLNHADDQEYVSTSVVGTPTNATVCDGDTVTLECDISQSNGVVPVWIVFNTSGSSVASLNSGDNRPPYNYYTVRAGDTVARLEVAANSSINGYHLLCRLDEIPPVYSPGTGSITVIGIPSCPTHVDFDDSTLGSNDCDVSLTWQQPPNTPPVTSTTVTYCPTSSPNCGNSMNCTSPCSISGLLKDIEYQFTVIPNNNCGSPTGCTGNTVTRKICSPVTTPTTGLDSTPQPVVPTELIGVVLAVVTVLIAVIIAIITTIILICRLCPGVKTYFVTTCCCKSAIDAKNKQEQPRDVYADPQIVRDNKEKTEENGITYGALQFSEEADGNGKNDIHCKEKLGNVQYSEVEHLQA